MNTANQRRKSASQRFSEKVDAQPSGCWHWTGTLLDNGYGQFWLNGKNRAAHRVAYEMHVGPIPEGLQIDHLCRNTKCVNPDHLEPVTCRENLLRGNTFQRHNALKTHCNSGHPLSGENLYVNPSGARVCRQCGREWGRQNADKAKKRHAGYKNQPAECVICGEAFVTDRYHPAATCSKPCANELCSRTKRAA